MSDTIYTDEELEIIHQKIIGDICCGKESIYGNNKTEVLNNKQKLLNNLKIYKIIGCIKQLISKHDNTNNTHNYTGIIKYINIHGDIYRYSFSSSNSTKTCFTLEEIISSPFKGKWENNVIISLDYIKKSFTIPKSLLYSLGDKLFCKIDEETDYKILQQYVYRMTEKDNEYLTNLEPKASIYYNKIEENIYISHYKNLNSLVENNKQYASIFEPNCNISSIELQKINIKDIIEHFERKRDELIRIAEEKRIKEELIAKQKEYEINCIVAEKRIQIELLEKEKKEQLNQEQAIKDEEKRIKKELIDKQQKDKQEKERAIKEEQKEYKINCIIAEKRIQIELLEKEKKEKLKQEQAIKDEETRIKEELIAKNNIDGQSYIDILKSQLILENNKHYELNLCDYLPCKTKKIINDNGEIDTITYTDIFNIRIFKCDVSTINKYCQGVKRLIILNCPNLKCIGKEVKSNIEYLQIDDDILINTQNWDYKHSNLDYIESNMSNVSTVFIESSINEEKPPAYEKSL